MSNLYIMMGTPGSGKSTFIQKHLDPEKEIWVSRDKIRFSLLKEGEAYFSHEDEVFKTFCKEIEQGLKDEFDVFADATHLNRISRYKLIVNIDPSLYENLYAVYIKCNLETALEHNENRKGTKAYVPRTVIRRMAESFVEPSLDEGFNKIYIVDNSRCMMRSKLENGDLGEEEYFIDNEIITSISE